jgi:XisI protein
MDKTLKYQDAIVKVLTEFSEFWKTKRGVKNQVVVDKDHHIYQLNIFGWQDSKRYVHLVAFHLEIIDDKVWIHQNNTEAMIGDELIEAGIAKNDIVLGFLEPEVRQYSGFATA